MWKKYWNTERGQLKGEVERDICSEREGGGERMKGYDRRQKISPFLYISLFPKSVFSISNSSASIRSLHLVLQL